MSKALFVAASLHASEDSVQRQWQSHPCGCVVCVARAPQWHLAGGCCNTRDWLVGPGPVRGAAAFDKRHEQHPIETSAWPTEWQSCAKSAHELHGAAPPARSAEPWRPLMAPERRRERARDLYEEQWRHAPHDPNDRSTCDAKQVLGHLALSPSDVGPEGDTGSDNDTVAPSDETSNTLTPTSSREDLEGGPSDAQAAQASRSARRRISFDEAGPQIRLFRHDPDERQLVIPSPTTRRQRRRQRGGCDELDDGSDSPGRAASQACKVM